MGIASDRPERGIRISIERDATASSAPWRYRGKLTTPSSEHPIEATVDASGEVMVHVDPAAPSEAVEKIRLILRTAYRQAKSDGDLAPARKIVRWRGQK